MTPAETAPLITVGLIAGAAVGAVGVGGVIVVPFLVGVAGFDPIHAVAAAELGYVVTGFIGLHIQARSGALERRGALPLLIASAPAAALGALIAPYLPSALLAACLAILMMAGGVAGLRDRRGGDGATMAGTGFVGCGIVTGLASALTGTGGPAVLLPLLSTLQIRPSAALALAQVVQVPVAGAATVANLAQGTLRWPPSIVLATALAFGSWAGAHFSVSLDAELLRRWICRGLILAGMALAAVKTIAAARPTVF